MTPDISYLRHDPVPFEINGNGRTWKFFKPFCPEKLLDLLTEKQFEKDRFLPYWAELWPASEAMFALISEIMTPGNKTICDLGCGLGIVSAQLSANKFDVTACDISFDACLYAKHNILLHSAPAKVVCCDWRKSPFKEPFGAIVAADITYEKQCIAPVTEFLSNSLINKGRLLIADPRRNLWINFREGLEKKGFVHTDTKTFEINAGKTMVEIVSLQKEPVAVNPKPD
jgi:SAM-dependent methyltransferase